MRKKRKYSSSSKIQDYELISTWQILFLQEVMKVGPNTMLLTENPEEEEKVEEMEEDLEEEEMEEEPENRSKPKRSKLETAIQKRVAMMKAIQVSTGKYGF
jgi:hypothetical protein